jgi:hypothetical protein
MPAFIDINFQKEQDYHTFKWCLDYSDSRMYIVYEKTQKDKARDIEKKGLLQEKRMFSDVNYEHQMLDSDWGCVFINKSKLKTYNQDRIQPNFIYPVEMSKSKKIDGRSFYIKIITPHFVLNLDHFDPSAGASNSARRLMTESEFNESCAYFLFSYDPQQDTTVKFNCVLTREEMITEEHNPTFFKRPGDKKKEMEKLVDVPLENADSKEEFIMDSSSKCGRCVIL